MAVQAVTGEGVSQLSNVAFMGTYVCGGHGKVGGAEGRDKGCGYDRVTQGVVISVGEQSEFGSVFKMMQSEEVRYDP